MKEICTDYFDKDLLELDIYNRYPQLLPLIGEQFTAFHKRVLFVGESHYLPNTSSIHNDAASWYD